MDPVSLTLGGVVAGLVAKAVDAGGDRLVAGAAGALGRVTGWLRARFTERDDASATTALERVEDAPDSPSRLQALADAVDRLVADETLRAELEALVTDVGESGVDVGSIVQSAWGNQNVQIAGIKGSDVQVNFGKQ